jgi:hypothetical protein
MGGKFGGAGLHFLLLLRRLIGQVLSQVVHLAAEVFGVRLKQLALLGKRPAEFGDELFPQCSGEFVQAFFPGFPAVFPYLADFFLQFFGFPFDTDDTGFQLVLGVSETGPDGMLQISGNVFGQQVAEFGFGFL